MYTNRPRFKEKKHGQTSKNPVDPTDQDHWKSLQQSLAAWGEKKEHRQLERFRKFCILLVFPAQIRRMKKPQAGYHKLRKSQTNTWTPANEGRHRHEA